MNFDLSTEQYELQDVLREMLRERRPLRLVHDFADAARDRDDDLRSAIAGLGLAGLAVPAEYGGLGLGVLDAACVTEELGYALAPVPYTGHVLATMAIARFGTDEQRKEYLPGLAEGRLWAGLAWDAGALGTLADAATDIVVLVGDGIEVTGPASADDASVNAGTARAGRPADGTGDGRLAVTDRTRPMRRLTGAVRDAGRPRAAAEAAEVIACAGRVLAAADAYGAARRCLELTVQYAKTRRQWGRVIGGFQAVKHQLADLALMVEPSRALHWYAAHAIDAGLPDAPGAAALAKLHTCERAVDVGRGCVELHGGIGYTWECDVHLFLRRALLNRVYFGTAADMRRLVASAQGW